MVSDEEFSVAFHKAKDVLKDEKSKIFGLVKSEEITKLAVTKAIARCSESRARELLRRVRARIAGSQKQPFQEALRSSLNEMDIFTREDREVYKAFVGYAFGPRGNRVKRRIAAQPKRPTLVERPPPPIGLLVNEKTGQLGWDI